MSKLIGGSGLFLALAMMVAMIGLPAPALAADGVHRVVFHLDENDPARMNLVLNNVANLNNYYLDKAEEAEIEVVAYGPGLNMLREDTSPVKDRVKSISQSYRNVSFKACANTLAKMEKKAGKDVPLVAEAAMVPSGVIHLVQRQEEGWSYIRP